MCDDRLYLALKAMSSLSYNGSMVNLTNKRILIPKVNQVGDVVLALPLASVLKQADSSVYIMFMGRGYTQALIEQYADVDEFVDWDDIYQANEQQAIEKIRMLRADIIINIMANKPADVICRIAKKAQIPLRIGSLNRFYTLINCNRFVFVSRKKCQLHEAQYDLCFLRKLIPNRYYSKSDIIDLYHFKTFNKTAKCLSLLDKNRFNLILHTKYANGKLYWSIEHFKQLIALLPETQFNLIMIGSSEEALVFAPLFQQYPRIINLVGKTTLEQLMQLIKYADGLMTNSTGPIHLAAAFGIRTLGLYPAARPRYPQRWGPIGRNAEVLIDSDPSSDNIQPGCTWGINPEQVKVVLKRWYQQWSEQNF